MQTFVEVPLHKNNPTDRSLHTSSEAMALQNLTDLLDENEPTELIDSIDLESLLAEVEGATSTLTPSPSKTKNVSQKI